MCVCVGSYYKTPLAGNLRLPAYLHTDTYAVGTTKDDLPSDSVNPRGNVRIRVRCVIFVHSTQTHTASDGDDTWEEKNPKTVGKRGIKAGRFSLDAQSKDALQYQPMSEMKNAS